MGWDRVQVKSRGTGAGFLTFKDGDTKKVHIIDDEPYTFSSVFFNAIKKSAVVDPNDNPVKGVKGFDVRERHAINVFDYDDGKVKVLAGSPTMFNGLKAIHEEWGNFEGVDVKITRTGTGFDTEYQIVPAAKCNWDPSLIEGQTLHDLETVFMLTPQETVQSYIEGIDPGTEFDPAKIEKEVVEDAEPELEITPDEPPADDFIPEERTVSRASAKPVATRPTPKPVATPKPATTAAPGRNELIVKINSLIKTKARYQKPGVWKFDMQRMGGKDKQSMSQLSTETLAKLLRFVQTVK